MELVDTQPDLVQLERDRLAKAAAAQAQLERLLKRAAIITTTLRKFIAEWTSARQTELDAARAAAAAKGGKKKGKQKKGVKEVTDSKDKKKKALKTPVAEAWSGVMTALDELVNKNKRVNLEDMYRGTELLAPSELCTLRNIMATANKKYFPDNMNLNQLNVKNSLWAAAAAHEYAVVDRALLAPAPGLSGMRDKGLGAKQLVELGYREGDLLRAGFTPEDVCEVSGHDPARLHAAGLSVAEVVAGCSGGGGVHQLPRDLQGFRGVQKLRAAGYSATELVAGGIDNAWDLRQAGFSASDVFTAGVPAEALRPAGYGLPELQPPSFLGPSFSPLQTSDPRQLPAPLEGTRGGIWLKLLQPQPPSLTLNNTAARNSGGTARLATGTLRAGRPGAAASPSGGGGVGADSPLPRNVAWPDTPSAGGGGGGGGGALATAAPAGALPPAPGVSRTGSVSGSVRSGG